MARTHKLKMAPCPENSERQRLNPSHLDKSGKLQTVPGKPVRSLLAALLARQGGKP